MRVLPWLMVLVSTSAMADEELRVPGERIEYALAAQVTADGFDAIGDTLEVMIPDLIPADVTTLDGVDFSLGTIDAMQIQLDPDSMDVTLIPKNGYILMTLQGEIGLSSEEEPFTLDLACEYDGWVDPFPVTFQAELQLEVITDGPDERHFEVHVDSIEVEMDMSADDFHLDSNGGWACDVLGSVISGLIPALDSVLVNYLEPVVESLVDGFAPQITDMLEAAVIDQEFPIMDSVLYVQVLPKQVVTTHEGMEVIYSIGLDAPQAPCIADVDPEGSRLTDTPRPPVTDVPSSFTAAAVVADDVVNQAMYALFRSGVMCFVVEEDMVPQFPIDTSLLKLLGGDGYKALLGSEGRPMVIRTKPREVPVGRFDGPHAVDLSVRRLGIDFIGELDHRMARLLALEVGLDVGADLAFDDVTGEVGLELDLDLDQLDIAVVPDVLVAGSEAQVEQGVSGLVTGVLEPMIGDLLGADTLAFGMPAFEGLGITELEAEEAGEQGDWLMAGLDLGPVSYASEGGGCGGDSTGCSGGCTTGASQLGWWLFAALPFVGWRRRRLS